MAYSIDFSTASSDQIEAALCARLAAIRLARNLTQADLAREAGVGTRTVRRLEKGEGVSFDTLIRVSVALGLQDHLAALLPDPAVRPVERAARGGRERRRARPRRDAPERPATWHWGDENGDG